MNTFSGIVTLDGEDVPVTIGLDNQRASLMSGDMEIGDWSDDECSITPGADGIWLIEAESEALNFSPGRPDLFARAVSERVGATDEDEDPEEDSAEEDVAENAEPETDDAGVVSTPEEPWTPAEETEREPPTSSSKEFEVVDGAPPRSATMIGFYVLAGITAVLGVWAVISIFF